MPLDVFSETGIQPGTTVQLQNILISPIRVFAGAALPENMGEYNVIEPSGWHSFTGAVLSAYAESGVATIVVQAV